MKGQCIKRRSFPGATSIPTFRIANIIPCNFLGVTLAADFQTGGRLTAVKLYGDISCMCVRIWTCVSPMQFCFLLHTAHGLRQKESTNITVLLHSRKLTFTLLKSKVDGPYFIRNLQIRPLCFMCDRNDEMYLNCTID